MNPLYCQIVIAAAVLTLSTNAAEHVSTTIAKDVSPTVTKYETDSLIQYSKETTSSDHIKVGYNKKTTKYWAFESTKSSLSFAVLNRYEREPRAIFRALKKEYKEQQSAAAIAPTIAVTGQS